VAKLCANIPVLDTGDRGSSVTLAQSGQGDVSISWKNEAHPGHSQPIQKTPPATLWQPDRTVPTVHF
jgi:ABC-type sulfate transport system substrate-binding protein